MFMCVVQGPFDMANVEEVVARIDLNEVVGLTHSLESSFSGGFFELYFGRRKRFWRFVGPCRVCTKEGNLVTLRGTF